MLRQFICWMLLLSGTVVCSTGSPAQTLSMEAFFHERPPYYIGTDQGVGGIVGDRAQFVLDQLDAEVIVSSMPASRQLILIERNQSPACAIGWFRNARREAFARFSDPIYRDLPTVVVSRSDNAAVFAKRTVHDLLSDRALILGIKLAYSYGSFLDGIIKALDSNRVETTQTNVGMMVMLHGGRFDYILMAPEEAEVVMVASGKPLEDFAVREFQDMPEGNDRHIICSKMVDEDIIRQMNEAIAEITK